MCVLRFTIDTKLPLDAAVDRVRRVTGARRDVIESFERSWRPRQDRGEIFVGKVDDRTFDIERDVEDSDPFLPTIRGHFRVTEHGTQIRGILRLNSIGASFLAVWLIFIGLAALRQPSLFLLVMLALGIAITATGFLVEAVPTRRLLNEILSDPKDA